MESGFALNTFGNVDGEFDAVVAHSPCGGGSIDGSTAVAAENTAYRKIRSCHVSLR